MLHPFFVFQIGSIILWSLDDYYWYAGCIFLITVISTIDTLITMKRNIRKMKQVILTGKVHEVTLYRNGVWGSYEPRDMVPGDIFLIESDKSGKNPVLPCDAVLLEGDCIVNESMLTGESLPVSKTPIPDTELPFLRFDEEEPSSSPRMSIYFLFSGTKIIRVRPKKATVRGAVALVVRTGFNTAKGSLVRTMLFPRPNQFKFYQDSFKFIGVLAVISAIGFLGSVYNFISFQVSWDIIVLRALDLITIAVPPALPATMAIGTRFAISRLEKSDIFCTSPPRVNICGKLNIMCFDKTGTLTEEGLDVLGVRFTLPESCTEDIPVELEQQVQLRFSALYKTVDSVLPTPFVITNDSPKNIQNSPTTSFLKPSDPSGASIFLAHKIGPNSEPDFPYPLLICAMATCHSIKVVKGELIGDPLDLKMFGFTGI